MLGQLMQIGNDEDMEKRQPLDIAGGNKDLSDYYGKTMYIFQKSRLNHHRIQFPKIKT